MAHPGGPAPPYASWGTRLAAYLLDGVLVSLPAFLALAAGFGLFAVGDEQARQGVAAVGVVVSLLGYLGAIAFGVWNQGWRQGTTGQSLGKQALDIMVVREDTGTALGGGTGLLRWLMMVVVGGACFLDFLWPLWDDKRQTWHDMIVRSIVVRTSPRRRASQ